MFGMKRVVIGDGERGLLYGNRRFERVLAPDCARLLDAFDKLEVRRFDPSASGVRAARMPRCLIERLGEALERDFLLAEDIAVSEEGRPGVEERQAGGLCWRRAAQASCTGRAW